MSKSPSKEKIEEEEYSLKQAIQEVDSLRNKWIKSSSTLRWIEFLDYYIKEKEKFIQKLRDFKKD